MSTEASEGDERFWWPGIFGFERPAWPQRRARIALLRRAVRASAIGSTALLCLVVVEAAIGVSLQLAGGRLVGAIPFSPETDGSPAAGRVTAALLLLGGLYLANNVVPAARSVLGTWLAARVDNEIRLDLMGMMLAPAGIGHLEDPDITDEVTRAGSLGLFTPGAAVSGMASILETRLTSAGSFALVVMFRWWLGIGLLLVALAIEAKARRNYMETARIVYRQTQDLRRSDYVRTMTLGGAPKDLRIFGLVEWMVERFTRHFLESMQAVWRERSQSAAFMHWAGPAMLGYHLIAFLVIGLAGVHGSISVGRVAVLIAATTGIRAFISYGLHRTRTEYGATAYLPIMDLEDKIAKHGDLPRGGIDPASMPAAEIRFEHVAFRYPGRDADVYTDLNLTIPAGRSVAIVGANGAGKTTFCKLLARCYEPTAGRITVDGVDLRDIDPRLWQRRVAAIFQDFVSFPLSVRDNVGFGSIEHVDDQDALEGAARRAEALDLVNELPHGWDTVLHKVFDKGTELSGGQAQRVALARALFAVDGGAGLLLLDEPTAALDVRTEAALFGRYLELTRGLTSVLISHRFSTVRRADHIFVLQDGTVTEEGSHDELVARGGRYAEMFELQASRFRDDQPAADEVV